MHSNNLFWIFLAFYGYILIEQVYFFIEITYHARIFLHKGFVCFFTYKILPLF